MTLLLILGAFLFDTQVTDESPRQRFYRAFFSEVAERKIREPRA